MTADTRNMLVTMLLLCSFATLLAVHAASVFGLASRRLVGRAAGAFFLPPLAPYFAFLGGMRVRAVAWVVLAVVYAVAFFLARSAA